MTRYKTVLGQLGQGYRVEIVGNDGVRQTVLGFSSENEAADWIVADQKLERLRRATFMMEAAD